MALKVPFVPFRKAGKLPGELESIAYGLEYKGKTGTTYH
jgi:adenine/guanine phosphoribosyltransferase-like PRPP-binding protein